MRSNPHCVAHSKQPFRWGKFPHTPFWGDTPRRENRAAPPDFVVLSNFFVNRAFLKTPNLSKRQKRTSCSAFPRFFVNFSVYVFSGTTSDVLFFENLTQRGGSIEAMTSGRDELGSAKKNAGKRNRRAVFAAIGFFFATPWGRGRYSPSAA